MENPSLRAGLARRQGHLDPRLGTLRQETWTPGGWGGGAYFPVVLPTLLVEPSNSKESVLIAVAF